MNGKKNPAKFTISFNEKNPKHQQAVTVLNHAGRNKAFLIAEALDVYLKICKQQIELRSIVPQPLPEMQETYKRDFPTKADNMELTDTETPAYMEVKKVLETETAENIELMPKEVELAAQVAAMDELDESDIDAIMANMSFLDELADET